MGSGNGLALNRRQAITCTNAYQGSDAICIAKPEWVNVLPPVAPFY